MKLDLEKYPHWEAPYNNYFYMVVNDKGVKKRFCHIDTAVNYYELEGKRLYIQTKRLHPTTILWKYKN